MQRDVKKLKEAQYRRVLMKFFAFFSALCLMPYCFFLVSYGYRNFLGLGHFWLLGALILMILAIWVSHPIYRLENPFLYSLDKRKKKEPKHE